MHDQLAADNSKLFWQANKATFEEAVKAPMTALCDDLAEYGPFHVFRPYNDLRFAKDRPPYKTHQGAYAESEGGAGVSSCADARASAGSAPSSTAVAASSYAVLNSAAAGEGGRPKALAWFSTTT